MELFLREPSLEDKDEIIKMCEELESCDDEIKFEGLSDLKTVLDSSFEDFINRIEGNKHIEDSIPQYVNQTTYVLADETGHIYGGVNIRHKLNDALMNHGGHIGYLIRPSERRKGYSLIQLKEALDIAKKIFNIDKVFISCREKNIGSKKTIEKTGGYSAGDNYIDTDGTVFLRYWIDL